MAIAAPIAPITARVSKPGTVTVTRWNWLAVFSGGVTMTEPAPDPGAYPALLALASIR